MNDKYVNDDFFFLLLLFSPHFEKCVQRERCLIPLILRDQSATIYHVFVVLFALDLGNGFLGEQMVRKVRKVTCNNCSVD